MSRAARHIEVSARRRKCLFTETTPSDAMLSEVLRAKWKPEGMLSPSCSWNQECVNLAGRQRSAKEIGLG